LTIPGQFAHPFTGVAQSLASPRRSSADFGKTGEEYHSLFLTLRAQGYHPIDASGYQTPNGVRYAALWEKSPSHVSWYAFRDVTRAGMQNLVDTIGQQGWVPHRVEAYTIGGESRYLSIWYYQPGTSCKMHNKMTREQYNEHLNEYKGQGLLPVHLDAHTVDGEVFYSGIWKQKNTAYQIRTNRNWRVFQRYYNNYWADGYFIDNFYAAETPDGIRYGGIWFYDGVPNITANSPLSLRVRKEVDGAPARGGAAIINLTTNQEVMLHADQEFAIASTSKIGILYALLREIDLGNESWNATINSGAQYGNNQGNWLQPNTNYTVGQMAQFMIRSSNNWATNRLIDRIGRETINEHLADPPTLNLKVTRIHRYMLGTGAPSAHGNSSAYQDHVEGWENLSTPREMVTLLRKVRNENILAPLSELRFWATLALDGDNDGANEKSYIPSFVGPLFNPPIVFFNKFGNVDDIRIHRGDAGAMVMPDGEVVLYAIFMDEISDDPDEPGQASGATFTAATDAIKNAGKEVATEYYP
jgi:beta-lactamase class A